jgi:hypothetical protein
MRYYQLAKVNKMRPKQHPKLVANFLCQSAAAPRFGAKHPLPAGSIKSNQATDLSKIFDIHRGLFGR